MNKIIVPQSHKIAIKVLCPTGYDRCTSCNLYAGNECKYQNVQEALLQDARKWQEVKRTVLEEMNR